MKFYILAGLCILLSSCKQNKPANESEAIRQKGDTIIVDENSIVSSKIKLYTVTEQNYSTNFNTTGTVKAITGQIAEIAPPFDGRTGKSFVRLGQRVNAGAPIFELHSTDFFEATRNYFQSLHTKKVKETNLLRQRDLVNNGVGVTKDLNEAETDYEIAVKDYENAMAVMKIFSANPDEITMGQPLKVVSPISGEVVQTNLVIGQYVKSDAAPLVIVAELDKVWVVAQVKERYIDAIHNDDKVEIRTDANPEEIIAGHVTHISELLDEETRSIQVLITCDNKNRKLKPGMFTSVHFINPPKPSILVPATALLQSEEDIFVFVCEGTGRFVKRKVKAISAERHESLICEGLNVGDTIVSEGGIYLTVN